MGQIEGVLAGIRKFSRTVIVAKVIKPKFCRTATKKLIASGIMVRIHILDTEVEGTASLQLFRNKSRWITYAGNIMRSMLQPVKSRSVEFALKIAS